MFGLGVQELLIILVIALVIFGPGRLPQIGSGLGKAIRDFKKSINGEDSEARNRGTAKKEADKEESDDEIVPISVDLYGSIPGLKIEAAKSKDSDADYVGIDMKIARSSTVKFFSLFIMFLMWGVTIGVMMLVSSILLRGRKIEIGMFSFLAALLFALIAVRNSQPGVPPIGTYSDFISFFWAEVILALCLLTLVFTWLLRPGAK